MKLTFFLTAALLPLGLVAAPVGEESTNIVAREPVDASANEPAGGIFKRNEKMCQIVGASVVNCRAGPGTGYRVVTTVKRGEAGIFDCVKSGEWYDKFAPLQAFRES
jgi:uncharacterized protein YgiM (DUF1202 family)